MAGTLVERQVETAVQGMLGNKAVRLVKGLNRIAAKQGGKSLAENYQLLGKRALIAVVVVQVVVSTVSFVVARRSEEQRMERVVRRVLEEERQKDEKPA